MVLLVQVMPQSSPIICVEGGEFSPLLRWFDYTFTHSLVVSLLSPNHPSMMGSPHEPQLTHLFSHMLLGFFFFAFGLQPHNVRVFFFVVLMIPLSILSLDHFACKMGLLTNVIKKLHVMLNNVMGSQFNKCFFFPPLCNNENK